MNLAEKTLVDGDIEEARSYMSNASLDEQPYSIRARGQALWILLDLLDGVELRAGSLSRLIQLAPLAGLPSSDADYGRLRNKLMTSLDGKFLSLGLAILDVLEGGSSPEDLQEFL